MARSTHSNAKAPVVTIPKPQPKASAPKALPTVLGISSRVTVKQILEFEGKGTLLRVKQALAAAHYLAAHPETEAQAYATMVGQTKSTISKRLAVARLVMRFAPVTESQACQIFTVFMRTQYGSVGKVESAFGQPLDKADAGKFLAWVAQEADKADDTTTRRASTAAAAKAAERSATPATDQQRADNALKILASVRDWSKVSRETRLSILGHAQQVGRALKAEDDAPKATPKPRTRKAAQPAQEEAAAA